MHCLKILAPSTEFDLTFSLSKVTMVTTITTVIKIAWGFPTRLLRLADNYVDLSVNAPYSCSI